ncbi:MAG TPA: M36 family metallopeptidase, partial [Rubricoccaceae bacterium]
AAGAVVHQTGGVASAVDVESATEGLGPVEAVRLAAGAVGVRVAGVTAGARRGGRSGDVPLAGPGLAEGSSARLVYHRTDEGRLRLAYEVALYPDALTDWWVVRVDAATGAELGRWSLVYDGAEGGRGPSRTRPPAPAGPDRPRPSAFFPREAPDGASYLVYPAPLTSPDDADAPPPADGRSVVVGPADPLGSPHGWHDTDGAPGPEHTTTRGNNAYAFPDRDADGAPDPTGAPEGGASLAFAAPLDLTGEPGSYTAAAVTNAFYWVNHVHDVLYHYGFDESSSNFQANGYDRGGGGDPVTVWVQNGSGTDNAYMVVPRDGFSPTMILLEGTRTSPRRDFAFDHTAVVHEYVHGLTARLVGGSPDATCLGYAGEQMGEGWSDWYALMLTMRPGDARGDRRGYSAYAYGQGADGPGVRPAYYSADPSVNGYTYGDTRTLGAPHGVGFVWATALWELTWDLVDAYGFRADLTDAGGPAGNQVALSLVTEALRLQPCRSGFVSARNAVLQADGLLYGGAHTPLLWAAFARRGLGLGASEGSAALNSDNVESFEAPVPGAIDTVPPSPVTDLRAVAYSNTRVVLTFTAPGDDGHTGSARTYEVRYSTRPIATTADFDRATRVGAGAPRVAGSAESVGVLGLARLTTYHFAVRSVDEMLNTSALSNPTHTTTLYGPAPTPGPTPGNPPGDPPPPPVSPFSVDGDSVVVRLNLGERGGSSAAVWNAGPGNLSVD